jgi:hypothetical protein
VFSQVELVLRRGEELLGLLDRRLQLDEHRGEQAGERRVLGGYRRGQVGRRLVDLVVGAQCLVECEDLAAGRGGQVGDPGQPQRGDQRHDHAGEVGDDLVGPGGAGEHRVAGRGEPARAGDRALHLRRERLVEVAQVFEVFLRVRADHHQLGRLHDVEQVADRGQPLVLQLLHRRSDLHGQGHGVGGALRRAGHVDAVYDDRHAQPEDAEQGRQHEQGQFAQDA